MSNVNNLKTNNSKSKIIIVFLCIIIAIAGVVIWYLAGNRQISGNEDKPKRDFVVNEENVDKIIEELNTPTNKDAPATYDVMMNSNWNFETGTSKSSNAHVTNSPTNKNIVYFDVYLADTKEVVYSSPYLRVGDDIKGFSLEKELAFGKYNAICKYYILDDDLKELCTVAVNVTLNIGSNK